MINNKIIFLCPESVPIDNKGEEAIIKGIIDTLGLSIDKCEYHIIDPTVKTLTQRRGLYLHPLDLFYPKWRTLEFGLGFSVDRLYASVCSAVRHLLNRVFPKWVMVRPNSVNRLVQYIQKYKEGDISRIPKRYRPSIEHLSQLDYIIAGHNGGLSIEVCHCLLAFKTILNIHYCIFGSCMKPKVHEKHQLAVYERMFYDADIVIARNPIGYRWAAKYFPNIDVQLAPDPAFGMRSILSSEADNLINQLGLSDFFKKDVILVTNAEPAPISRRSFDKASSREQKILAHRKFFASLLNAMVDRYDCNFLFLPHTIGPTRDMDDRLISKNIIELAGQVNDINARCYVLEADLSCAELKGIISKGRMLIAERVHSAIGAIGVHTPFICLASESDTRVAGMLKEMAGLSDNIYYLNNPDVNICMTYIENIMNNLDESQRTLAHIDSMFLAKLHDESIRINNLIKQATTEQ